VNSAPSRPSQFRPLRGLLISALLLVAFAALTFAAIGPLSSLDVALNGPRRLAPWRDELRAIDRIGQRAVCLPLLAVVAVVLAVRTRRLRPVTVAAVGVVSLNLTMLILKFSLGRGLPQLEDPAFFKGGDIYPSGHAGNVVLVYGLIVYLLIRYGSLRMRVRPWLVVAALSVIMVGTSLALRWHWFTDLIGGLMVGAAVLLMTCTVDQMIPSGSASGPSGRRRAEVLDSPSAASDRAPAQRR
jgi:membrane-associated phospholipid phosphatase